jgi:polyhydroxyalkanoate synthesis regulator phasin
MESITASALIAVVAALLGIAATYAGLKRNLKQDAANEGKNTGVVLNEISHIQSGIEEIKKEQARISDMMINFVRDLAVMSSKLDAEHRRTDALEKAVADLERRVP